MDVAASYDEIPYGERTFAATHPDRLATIAILHGLQPPSLETCRVLEIGCAAGGNLIPMGVSLPAAQFTGIDLSQRQIAQGQRNIAAVGVKNVHLHAMDILDFEADPGAFDFIICHGVYSWVPPAVQARILELCRRCLTPHGVAYISFNCLPGWHLRGTLRDLLLYHTRGAPDATSRIGQGREILQFLPQAFPDPDSLYASLLTGEARELAAASDDYLFHEHFEVHNEPFYFTGFVSRVRGYGLEYLAEAEGFSAKSKLKPEVLSQLAALSADELELEQYQDFLVARMFRTALLVKKEAQFSRGLVPDAVRSLRFSSNLRPKAAGLDVRGDEAAEFQRPRSGSVTTNNPWVKSVLVELAREAPGRLSFRELKTRVESALGLNPLLDEQLRDALLQCCEGGVVQPHVQEQPFSSLPPPLPMASPFARWRAAADGRTLVNLDHSYAEIGEFDRLLLLRLDGEHDRAGLREEMLKLAREGVFSVKNNGAVVSDPEQLREVLDAWIEQGLERLARAEFLLPEPRSTASL